MRKMITNLFALVVFIIYSLVFVDVAPAPPMITLAPVGGAIPSGITIAAIAVYGFWRMKR